jgi:hypothetical protein
MDGKGMELEEDQRTILRTGSKQVKRAAAVLRSVNPESFRAAEHAKRICDQAWGRRSDEPTVRDVVHGFAGLLRHCPTLGPETQEVLPHNLERLIERLGLSQKVNEALQVSEGAVRNGRYR